MNMYVRLVHPEAGNKFFMCPRRRFQAAKYRRSSFGELGRGIHFSELHNIRRLRDKREQTCSLAGRLKSRSACIRLLDCGWKKATSLFLKPEKKLINVSA